MSTRAERARAKHERIQAMQQATAEDAPRSRVQSARSRPVRRTVDLSPVQHQRLAQWCAETAIELGAARVTGQDALRALVARLLTDETLARKIRADLADDFASR